MNKIVFFYIAPLTFLPMALRTNKFDYSNDPMDLSQGNWGLWAFRGKRYEAVEKEALLG